MVNTQPKTERTCRYGHGQLESIEGTWSFQGVEWKPIRSGDEVVGTWPDANGNGFTVHLWRCPVCRYVEMIDEDGAQK
ncbi:hypothetical protein SAMN02787076_03920 [Rhizobacter sp. OV335]|nr:hypothetical protein SAMN02787076_03920 [Rhizobacter sp. OV335]